MKFWIKHFKLVFIKGQRYFLWFYLFVIVRRFVVFYILFIFTCEVVYGSNIIYFYSSLNSLFVQNLCSCSCILHVECFMIICCGLFYWIINSLYDICVALCYICLQCLWNKKVLPVNKQKLHMNGQCYILSYDRISYVINIQYMYIVGKYKFNLYKF